MLVVSLSLCSIALAVLLMVACGESRLPTPHYVEHPTGALVEVPYPPPPARVETVPARPTNGDAVWIDGEWAWEVRRWGWKAGRWVIPPAGARGFAPWTSVRDRIGTLYVAAGAWRDSSGQAIPDPEPLASARPSRLPIVNPEGEAVEIGPNRRLDGGKPGGQEWESAAARSTAALDAALPNMDPLDGSATTRIDAATMTTLPTPDDDASPAAPAAPTAPTTPMVKP